MLAHIANSHFDGGLGSEDRLSPNGYLRVLVTPIVVREVEAKHKPQQIRRLEVQFEGTDSSMSPYQIQILDDSVTGEQLELRRNNQKRRGVNVSVNVEDLKTWKSFDGALCTSGGLLASGDLDIPLVSRWLDDCVKNHGNTCSMLRADRGDHETRTLIKGGFRLGSDVRVIDVLAMRICPALRGLAYCALGYLWGGVSMLKTTKDNFTRLSQENGIREDEIPLTIRDAIYFCRKIGWQYLWVEALCII
ncbi:hypothetical protein BDZ45DRAFT_419937 [Acephala macrosclerotiorum]|nr:hypothetical protein BDZ45DRAFT_419937 [Acephala macrosclerotiorum]